MKEGERGSINFPALNESTFLEVMIRNARLVKYNHVGVCFTMAAYVKQDLLYSMGIINDVYFMSSFSPRYSMTNYVILYKYDDEWKICDLAEHVICIKNCFESILSASASMERDKEYAEVIIMEQAKKLNDETNLAMELLEYNEIYPMAIWKIYLDKGHENDIFTDVPTVSFNELMQLLDLRDRKL